MPSPFERLQRLIVQQPGDPAGPPVVGSVPNVTTPKHWFGGENESLVFVQPTLP
jgi:hypothetical protein